MTTTDDVIEAVTAYRIELAAAKEKAKVKFEELVSEYVHDARVELSKTLHNAHESGIPIATLKSLTKAHNNASYWNPIWNAYEPATATDLRRKASMESESVIRFGDAEGEFWITFDGIEYLFENVVWDADEQTVTFDADPTYPDAYTFGWLALQEHFSKESE